MTEKQAREIIKNPCKPIALAALSFVNLTDMELDILIYRHMKGHTIEETAEVMKYSDRTVKRIELSAVRKCSEVWGKLKFFQDLLTAQ